MIISSIVPNKTIFFRLNSLRLSHKKVPFDGNVIASIEKEENKREFCFLTIDELNLLFDYLPSHERSLYECIPLGHPIKWYIDFEYSIEKNPTNDQHVALKTILIIMEATIDQTNLTNHDKTSLLDCILRHILIFNASTSTKISYHLIDTNSPLIFPCVTVLGTFMTQILKSIIIAMASHSCTAYQGIHIDNNITLSDLINVVSIRIQTIKINCNQCFLIKEHLSASDVAQLFVMKKNMNWTLCIDLNVYRQNQQFRLYDCVKYQLNNPLTLCQDYPFDRTCFHSRFEILSKSIITHFINKQDLSISKENTIFERLEIFLTFLSRHRINISKANENPNRTVIETSNTRLKKEWDQTIPYYSRFVKMIIERDREFQGTIHSIIRGTINQNIFFFNITGRYKYCPKIKKHHRHNSTAIIVDIFNDTFAIRCKDPDCDHTKLEWTKINSLSSAHMYHHAPDLI